MADQLVVRVYNVRFGDAILVTFPDRDPSNGQTTTRRILIDVGNAPLVASREGGDDSVFEAAVEDILAQLGGDPLDLYVMTHEHLDHVQGLPHAWWRHQLDVAARLKVRHVWMTASAAPGYYDSHPEAKKQKLAFEAMFARIRSHLALNAVPGHARLLQILANNDPTKTKECVEFLRTLNPAATTYVHRGVDLRGKHPFHEAKLEIWAPEEDTSEYYGKFQPLPAVAATGAATARKSSRPVSPSPPPGVDVGAFLNLVAARSGGIADNLLAIDQAANNTSVVFLLEWRGWRLLFAGDAETRSWKTMEKYGALKQVDFLKVSHHGSHNGTPDGAIFDAILAAAAPPGRTRFAAVSAWADTYNGIPHEPTNGRLRSRCELRSTLDDSDAPFFDLTFPADPT